MPAPDIARYRANLQDEIDSATLYRTMAEAEAQPQLAQVYRRLAAVEEKHADFWEQRLRDAGATVPARRASARSRFMAWLARRFGPQFVLPTVVAAESQDSAGYRGQPESRGTAMPLEEASHRRVLGTILTGTRGGLEGSTLARLEGRHRAMGGNALRAAVLGADDGLVSNLSLVMGVAGAALANRAILVTGFAGLLAGATSMALGEWLSVQSSRELNQRQIAVEADELAAHPEEEGEELALIFEAKGLDPVTARATAARLLASPENALDTLAREELGIDPEELGGSAWQAAITSFFLFAAGAIIPVSPFLFLSGKTAVVASLVVSALALFGIGAAITLMTGKVVLVSGIRQVLFGLGAAAATFLIGHLLGVALAG
ncbi:MAG TPA: VIT1/CCC1 family protein [Thermoanaerobaculia bacterium]|nr:VIT1/CCC1 family protein [Thermoanaerobaculia bacterium]